MPERIALPPYPTGWYCVGLGDELAAGDVRALRYFGRELVLFRTDDGEASLLDAYCPHLGAHLGHGGQVRGRDLVCPFHGWRFGPEGACTGMPYGRRIPAKARTQRWPLVERDAVLLAWHDAAGAPPAWSMPSHGIEREPGRVSPDWSATHAMKRSLLGHPQEVLENTADLGHFRFIHGTHVMRALDEPRTEGPTFEIRMESDPEALEPGYRLDPSLRTEGRGFCHGPGLTGATIVPKDSGLRALQRLYVTPIDEERIALHGLVNVGAQDDPKATDAFARELAKAVFEQWELDIPIWEHKLYRSDPALNETEGPIAVFRRWFEQFYDNAAR